MNLERFEQILQAYGASPHRWPEEERRSANELLARSEEATLLIREYRRLDELLDSIDAPLIENLEERILDSIESEKCNEPGSYWLWLDTVLEWLIPSTEQTRPLAWRPVMLASIVFTAGIFIGLNFGMSPEGDADSIVSLWENEVYWFALSTER